MPAVESKAADVFAFGMLAVEVFTGKIPFEEQKNEAAALRISQGGRSEMPQNAQAVGLTEEMWKLFEGCWQQDPKIRPTMEEVVKRLQTCVANSDGDNVVSECVQIILLIRAPSSVRFSTSMIHVGNRNLCQDPGWGPADPRQRLRLSNLRQRLRSSDSELGPRPFDSGRHLNPPRAEKDPASE